MFTQPDTFYLLGQSASVPFNSFLLLFSFLRSSRPKEFFKIDSLKISQNSQENTSVRVFFNKVAPGLQFY